MASTLHCPCASSCLGFSTQASEFLTGLRHLMFRSGTSGLCQTSPKHDADTSTLTLLFFAQVWLTLANGHRVTSSTVHSVSSQHSLVHECKGADPAVIVPNTRSTQQVLLNARCYPLTAFNEQDTRTPFENCTCCAPVTAHFTFEGWALLR